MTREEIEDNEGSVSALSLRLSGDTLYLVLLGERCRRCSKGMVARERIGNHKLSSISSIAS